MGKSHPFSIYLLKSGYDATNSLKQDHSLGSAAAAELPANATLYILDSDPKPPWWKDFFGVQADLWQEHKGALVFLPVADRYFALSFGQVFHHLNDEAYEYDFGLLVTLNSVDPNELKSADMVEPGIARRKRTQVPVSTELTYLDFDGNSEIIKCLTGKVKKEYEELFKNATGSVALKVNLKLGPNELAQTCEKLLTLYGKEDYKAAFPNIQNIAPVKDPSKIAHLDELLLQALRQREGHVTLMVPDIVDYRDNTCCVFEGDRVTSEIFPDISLEQFYEFLGDDLVDVLTIDGLKNYRMRLTDADGYGSQSYSAYRTLIFDAELTEEQVIYHLCEGGWYRVEKSYVARLKTYLDKKCEDSNLCPYDHDGIKDGKAVYSESNYNAAIPAWVNRFICLDQTDISPAGNTAIEPCDIYTVEKDPSGSNGHRGVLYHLKISTRSSHLSHLFSQGVNSIELIELEPTSRNKMKNLLIARLNGNDQERYLAPIEAFDFKVIFGIITHKDKALKSGNLPLFSKISLMRNMQRLDLMKVPSALAFIEDISPKKKGHPKHEQITVEVCALKDGKTEVRPFAGQGFNTGKPIKGCPKQIRESAVGTRFMLSVKKSGDGDLSSFHSWPFQRAA
ncbi:sporadically distributed protein, TIGR04141 family [Beijerinckiaceae bacterium]|nr:sporadically distributed protein, TIGR04141 family [Beijerinckiaceae bacterium]